ncbi:hypothetical protein P879_04156 [Paragonimus westermani]|uniref:MAM domain-containing protein n=1 Tax=Paragonimus westermani TaxID=34504 RepID=A0A8T0D0Z7_9TREM|nr:hypothetical protein P879_04156 [Paragonimus westermani]
MPATDLRSPVSDVTSHNWLSCDFEQNTESVCEWVNDSNNWFADWHPVQITTNNTAMCTRISRRGRQQTTAEMAKPRTIRLVSPPVSNADGLKCLQMYTLFTANLDTSSYSLALLRRQEGILPVCLLAWNRILSEVIRCIWLFCDVNKAASSSSNPIHVCTFAGNTCGWKNDLNSWRHRWLISSYQNNEHGDLGQAVCLSANPADSDSDTDQFLHQSPWSVGTEELDPDRTKTGPVQARLWSPPILRKRRLNCLTFTYHIYVGVQLPSVSNPGAVGTQHQQGISLALLRRQDG